MGVKQKKYGELLKRWNKKVENNSYTTLDKINECFELLEWLHSGKKKWAVLKNVHSQWKGHHTCSTVSSTRNITGLKANAKFLCLQNVKRILHSILHLSYHSFIYSPFFSLCFGVKLFPSTILSALVTFYRRLKANVKT